MSSRNKLFMTSNQSGRIAMVDAERCQPHKCKRECERFRPVNRLSQLGCDKF